MIILCHSLPFIICNIRIKKNNRQELKKKNVYYQPNIEKDVKSNNNH
jgi:hypothetical protein